MLLIILIPLLTGCDYFSAPSVENLKTDKDLAFKVAGECKLLISKERLAERKCINLIKMAKQTPSVIPYVHIPGKPEKKSTRKVVAFSAK